MLALGIACLGVRAQAEDAALVSFDSARGYLSKRQASFTLPEPVEPDEQTRTWKYSETDPLLAPGGDYSGPEIYGALQIRASDPEIPSNGEDPRQFHPNYAGVVEGYPTPPATPVVAMATAGTQLSGMFFFKLPETLPGHVALTDQTLFELEKIISGNVSRICRLVIKNGGVWYISRKEALDPGEGPISEWAEFSPAGAAPLPEPPPEEAYSVSGSEFTHIQAVGVYFQSERKNNHPYFTLQKLTFRQ